MYLQGKLFVKDGTGGVFDDDRLALGASRVVGNECHLDVGVTLQTVRRPQMT